MNYIIFGKKTKHIYKAGMFADKEELRRTLLGIKTMLKNADKQEGLIVAHGDIAFTDDSDFVSL